MKSLRKSRPPWRPLVWAALLLIPFAVRAVYHVQASGVPYLRWPLVVSSANHELAADLARGEGAPYTLFRSPWYPLFLSWIHRLPWPDIPSAVAVQALLGGLSCLAVAALARMAYGTREAVAALLIASLHAPSWFYEGEMLEQAPAGFLLAAGTALLMRSLLPPGGPAAAAAGGAALGAAALMRPDLWLAVAAALVVLL
ncbi:MAG TPA: hypothetical protein VJV23_11335, partial [Candidatus Polarisedimenticolia bacterium]|nr:hypothetical protein [Candidatus Polarisedimenticolia bacterium]